MSDPIWLTLLKMRPHYSQSSHENATPSSGTSPLASYKEVTPQELTDPIAWSKTSNTQSKTFQAEIWPYISTKYNNMRSSPCSTTEPFPTSYEVLLLLQCRSSRLRLTVLWSQGKWISERFRQFCFFTKRSTLLLEKSRKINFLHLFFIEQHAKLLPFLLMLVD